MAEHFEPWMDHFAADIVGSYQDPAWLRDLPEGMLRSFIVDSVLLEEGGRPSLDQATLISALIESKLEIVS